MDDLNELKRSTSLNRISFTFQGIKHTIDLTKELSINQNTINSQLKEYCSSYSFLILVKSKLCKKRDELEDEKDNVFSNLYCMYQQGNSKMTKDTIYHKVISNKKYQSINKRFLEAKSEAEKLISVCRAYEDRGRILQTLSANLRREQ